MLVIRAISFKGRPLPRELSATFSEAGGTIGRGDSATLVLPDPERFISRTHAAVAYQAGGFVITDSGAKNPIVLNGRPLGQGSQARLQDGDEITLGDYRLAVTLTSPSAATSGSGLPAAHGGLPAQDDPLAAFGIQARAASDPLATLTGREPSIDELFQLDRAPSSDPFAALPGLGSLSGTAASPAPVDPLAVLQGGVKPGDPPVVPVADQAPELFTPFRPPAATPDPALAPPVEPAPAVPREILPEDWMTAPVRRGSGDAPPSSPPVATPASAPPLPTVEPTSAVPDAPAVPAAPPFLPAPPVTATSAPTTTPARSGPASGATADALLRAFLAGAGIPDTRLPGGLTPEAMERIGQLFREAVQGTLDLLRARGLTKSEMRADVTMIVPVDNNPLKFSPSVEAALTHLLSREVPGFIPPVRAMRDAYDDLRAHQLGFLAGMRAALDDVLARFVPEELEKRLSEPGMLDNLLPMSRRAKLWQLFVERYRDVAAEAHDDFNAAFGKAFVRAYEAQVKRVRSEERR
jgi:type VI secretion system FHA domain protein